MKGKKIIKQVEIKDKWKKLDSLFTTPLKSNTLYQLQIVGNTPVYFADDKAYTETDGANGLIGNVNTIVNFVIEQIIV